MTRCKNFWQHVMRFAELDDFDGFCEYCGSAKNADYRSDEWRLAKGAVKLQRAGLEISSHPVDFVRVLLRKDAAPFRMKIIEKMKTLPKEERTTKTLHVLLSDFMKPQKPEIPRFEKAILEANKPDWKALMRQPISRMDEVVFQQLQRMGISCEFQREFCIRKTVPDIYVPQANLAVYLDGAVAHQDSEVKDQLTRDLLSRQGIRVLSLKYGVFSPGLAYSLACEVRDAVKMKVKA